jgi:hypothetical protein
VPFDFLKRNKAEPASGSAASAVADSPVATPTDLADGRQTQFRGFTEEWRLEGTMAVEGRLTDVLNKREPIAIDNVRWAPLDGSSPMVDAPGLRSIDPYDLIIVIAGDGSLPPMSEEERRAHRIHKVRYPLVLELPPFRVIGTVHLYPGSEPDRLLDRGSEMFLPVVDARATLGDEAIDTGGVEDILINRAYLRGVDQVDRRTGERSEPLPMPPTGVAAGAPAEEPVSTD